MLRPKKRTWFLVIDGAKARLFESMGRSTGWALKSEWENSAARLPSRALDNERPGRGHTIGSGGRYAIAGNSKHDSEERSFVKARAEFLNAAGADFDQLVLAAPPGVLGQLRKRLSADVAAKFVGVFDKDLTNMPDQELHAYFVSHLERW